MLSAFLGLVLAAAAPIGKLEAPPKVEAPKIDLKLPEIPKAEGLQGASAPKNEEMQTKSAAGDLRSVDHAGGPTAKVVSVVNAKDFTVSKAGRKPVGRVDSFSFASLPAHVGAFKTCVRLSSVDGVPVSLKATFKSPAGNELLSSRADVTFGENNEMDVVIEWDGFEANAAGEYKLVVTIDGKAAGEFALPVQAK